MFDILIMDTDRDSVRYFQTHLRNSFPQIKTIHTAANSGEDIQETLQKLKPQLIIANIQFFGITSHLAIRGIHEKFPDIRFILYGNYNESEYIQKSLEYGVLHYMYRPIKPGDFNRSMEAAMQYFRKAEDRKKVENEIIQSYKQQIHRFREIFISGLFEGLIPNDEEIRQSFAYFQLELPPPYTVLLIHIDHYKKMLNQMDDMQKHLLTYKLRLLTEKSLESHQFLTFISSFDTLQVILCGSLSMEQLVNACEGIKTLAFDQMDLRVSAGIGDTVENPSQIHNSQRGAKSALLYRFIMGYNSVIHINFAEPRNKITYYYPIEKEYRLIKMVAVGEYDYCVRLLREMFDTLKACEPLPANYLPKVIMNILISVSRYLNEQDLSPENPFLSFFPSRDVLELGNDIEKAFDYLCAAMKNFCEHIVSCRDDVNKAFVDDSKAYLSQKFNESFSLSRIAAQLGTTPEYLNRVFVEKENQNIFDYAMEQRIQAAKRLMRETAFDDEVVAMRVGYENSRHFRSLFKRQEGISTFEYRKKYNIFNKN